MFCRLILILVPKEVVLLRIIGPDVFDGLVDFAFLFKFLKIFNDLKRAAGTLGIVQQFVLGGGPGRVFKVGSQFKCPIHSTRVYKWFVLSVKKAKNVSVFRFFLLLGGKDNTLYLITRTRKATFCNFF